MLSPDDVLTFWFEELEPQQQFKKSQSIDEQITTRFLPTWGLIMAGETEYLHRKLFARGQTPS